MPELRTLEMVCRLRHRKGRRADSLFRGASLARAPHSLHQPAHASRRPRRRAAASPCANSRRPRCGTAASSGGRGRGRPRAAGASRAGAIRELLFDSPAGSLEWDCVAPRSAAQFLHRWGRAVSRMGLCGTPAALASALAPAHHQLRWGRFVNATDALVWIDWRGPYSRQVVYYNGAAVARGRSATRDCAGGWRRRAESGRADRIARGPPRSYRAGRASQRPALSGAHRECTRTKVAEPRGAAAARPSGFHRDGHP